MSQGIGLMRRDIWLRLIVLSVLLAAIELATLFALRYFFMHVLLLAGGDLPAANLADIAASPAFTAIALVGGVLVARFALSLAIARRLFQTVLGEQARITSRLFQAYLARSWHDTRDTSASRHVQTILLTVTRMVNQFLLPLTHLLGEALVALAIFAVLLILEPVASLAVGVWLALFFAAIALATRRPAQNAGQSRWREMNAMRDALDGALGDVRVVRLAAAEDRFASAMGQSAKAHAAAIVEENVIERWPQYARDLGLLSAICVALLVFLLQGRDAASLSVGLVLFAAGALRLLPAIHRLMAFSQKLYLQAPDLEQVIADLDHAVEQIPAANDGPREPLFAKSIALADLGITLPGQNAPMVSGVNLAITKGEHVAISGPSGSGKSTLLLALCGLLQPTAGRILVDGVEAGDILAKMRRANVALVPQDSFVADLDLAGNLAFPHDAAALDMAQAQMVCTALHLPDPADCPRETVQQFSGGERQRLALARALCRNPELLILDEATSQLDPARMAEAFALIAAQFPLCTVIAVSHQPIPAELTVTHRYQIADGKLSRLS